MSELEAGQIVKLIDKLMDAKFHKRDPHIGLATIKFYEQEEGQARSLLERALRDALVSKSGGYTPGGAM